MQTVVLTIATIGLINTSMLLIIANYVVFTAIPVFQVQITALLATLTKIVCYQQQEESVAAI